MVALTRASSVDSLYMLRRGATTVASGVDTVSEAESKIYLIIFSTFSFWITSTCVSLYDFIYGFSLPFHKLIHLQF